MSKKKTKKITVQRKLEMADRAMFVAAKMSEGWSIKEISDHFNRSMTTIYADIRKLAKQFKERAGESVDIIRGRQLAELDRLRIEYIRGFERSRQPKISKKKRRGEVPGGKVSIDENITQEQIGDPRWLNGFVQCLEHEARIMGVEKVAEGNVGEIKQTLNVANIFTDAKTKKLWDRIRGIQADARKRELRDVGNGM